MARPERFELPTNWFEASYSIQLSYGRAERPVYMRWWAPLIFSRQAHPRRMSAAIAAYKCQVSLAPAVRGLPQTP